MIRTTEFGWEDAVLAAIAEGRPFRVATHSDPLVRLDALAHHVGHGSGHPIPDEVRGPLAQALRDAHDEGHTWDALARRLGLPSSYRRSNVRMFAGLKPTCSARWYREQVAS